MFSDPVLGEDFFNRENILSLLEKRVEAFADGFRQNIAITGPELVGKTSLVHHLLSNKINIQKVIPVYIQIHKESPQKFIKKFIGSCLYGIHISANKNTNSKISYEQLVESAKADYPKIHSSIEQIDRLNLDLYYDKGFEILLEMLNVIVQETEKRLLIVIDEFHALEDLKFSNPFLYLANQIIVQKDVMYLLVSSNKTSTKEILSKKLSLLFGNFEMIELGPFSSDTAKKFISKRLEKFSISTDLKEFLAYFTGGYPLFLDIIIQESINIATIGDSKEISIETLTKAVESAMFNSRGIISQYYLNLIYQLANGKSWTYYLSILLSITDKNISISQIAKSLKKSNKEITKYVNKLIDCGILAKYGHFIIFVDRLFSFWLKNAYNLRQTSFIYDVNNLSKLFRNLVENTYKDYIREMQKKKEERLLELFKLFNNDLMELDGKTCRLPQFTTVKLKSIHNGYPFIAATRKNAKWLCTFQDHAVSENKILSIIDSMKKNKKAYNKRILITLNGMDINAKLYAKEANIWLWDKKEANLLFEIYKNSNILS